MNLILEKTDKMDFFTDLRIVFHALKNLQLQYSWLITDLECNFLPEALQGHDRFWLTGEELTSLINQYPDSLQFIWAVLSGFSLNEKIDINNLEVIPYADCNPSFWSPNPKIQHPKAEIEIVCWDGTTLLILSQDKEITENFKAFFPEAEMLEEYNMRRKK